MLCTFCGTDNRPENKFCGMCGVRLERRQADRRNIQQGISLKCASCGHINEPGYKFCGICGTRIERRVSERRGAEPAAARASAAVPSSINAVSRRAEAAVAAAPVIARQEIPRYTSSAAPALHTEPARELRSEPVQEVRSEPVRERGISGPSFLGLGSDPVSDDGEYLLEEESSSHGGLRAFLLLLIVAAIVGLIFVQYRASKTNSGAPQQPKPAPAGVPQPAGQNGQPAGPAPAAPSQNAQATVPGNMPQSDNSTASDPPNVSAKSDNSASPDSVLAAVNDPAGVKPTKLDEKASSAPPGDPADPPDRADSTDRADPADAAADVPDKSAAKVSSKAKASPATPSDTTPRKPSVALVRAQQYLQGRGVPQNCEQGLIYLRVAAQKNEPDAAVQMGALYASGHCVTQDRVMAYRWFNSAHELQPANPWIEQDMRRLLGEMTLQERHQVGY